MLFYPKCPLSHESDKSCKYALVNEKGIQCRYAIGWYHKLNIKYMKFCFLKMKNRDRLSWRNQMIKKFGKPKI